MIHEKFEIERWSNLFSLEKLRAEARQFVEARRAEMPDEYPNEAAVERHVKLMSPSGEIVTSPCHLATVEQLRAECLSKRRLPTAPTDVFVFAKGEPPDRGVTKVGGLPFWPGDRTWPIGKSGEPMDFIAQFCFADSADLFDALPGEILLIFADGVYLKEWDDEDKSALRFEWIKRAQVNPIEAANVPKRRWELIPVYGQVHRTVDYLTGGIWEKEWWSILLRRSKSPRDLFSGLGARRALVKKYRRPWCIAMIQGTKIGGVPSWIQDAEELPGRFLCALGSIHPVYETGTNDIVHRPFPFTNVPGPYVSGRRVFRSGNEEIPTNQLLMWGDVGSLYLFLDDEGSIHWTIQFY